MEKFNAQSKVAKLAKRKAERKARAHAKHAKILCKYGKERKMFARRAAISRSC